uniref:Uncharacterized protein n=1 Tax=Oryza barthii TaxID=65489 RepID=A0A0D3HQ00_9ORYZ
MEARYLRVRGGELHLVLLRPSILLPPSVHLVDPRWADGAEGALVCIAAGRPPDSISMEGSMFNLPGRLDRLLLRHGSMLPKGAEEEIPLIKQDLEEIISILHGHCSEPKLENHAMVVRCWMKEVRELSYDIEDCIDQYEHATTATRSRTGPNIRRRKFNQRHGKMIPGVPWKLKQRLWMANKIREFSLRTQEALQRHTMYNNLGGITIASTTGGDACSATPWHPTHFREHTDNIRSVGIDADGMEAALNDLNKLKNLLASIPTASLEQFREHANKVCHIHPDMEAILNKLKNIPPGITTTSTTTRAENLWSLGELSNLRDLQLTYSEIHSDNLKDNMKYLGFILGKLRNLTSITLSPPGSSCPDNLHIDRDTKTRINVDGWSSVSSPPALLQRFELLPCVCIFSNLPNWIGQLGNLCILKIGIREVTSNNIDVLGVLPELTVLSLYVHTKPAERIVFDNAGFSILKYFEFICSVAWMKFEMGTMPSLRKLKLGFDVHIADQHDIIPVGIEHLSGLEEISAKIRVACTAHDHCRRFAESALTNAFMMHPGRPSVNIRCVDWTFHDKDNDCVGTREEECRTPMKQEHFVKEDLSEKSAVLQNEHDEEAHKFVDRRYYSIMDAAEIRRCPWSINEEQEQPVLIYDARTKISQSSSMHGEFWAAVQRLTGPAATPAKTKRHLHLTTSPELEDGFLPVRSLVFPSAPDPRCNMKKKKMRAGLEGVEQCGRTGPPNRRGPNPGGLQSLSSATKPCDEMMRTETPNSYCKASQCLAACRVAVDRPGAAVGCCCKPEDSCNC